MDATKPKDKNKERSDTSDTLKKKKDEPSAHCSTKWKTDTQKRPFDDKSVLGYLHNTSPVKRSKANNPYFDAELQTGPSQYSRVVCFNKHHHQFFKESEEKRSPIKLMDIVTAPNWQDKSKTDIKVTKDTTLEANKKTLAFKPQQPPVIQPITTTVTEFVRNIPSTEKKKINLTAYVSGVVEEECEITLSYRSEPTKNKVYAIADENTSTKLTAWATIIDSIQVHNTYKFENLSVSNFNIKHLQTTFSTIVTKTNSMDNPCLDLPTTEELTELTQAKCETVQSEIVISCNSCQASIDIDDLYDDMYKCNSCGMRQLSNSVIKQVKVKLNLSDHGVKYRINARNPALSDFMKFHQAPMDTTEEIDGFFLRAEPFGVKFNTNLMAVSFSTES
ncbi:uncharacterized protein LOC135482678 [Lineus longissimus]|uniref:uncharacterized protein LOC135482678 n=1 Tax=Lineus longissimus TaxID=88925 RepID=UPI002B4E15FE